MPEWVVIYFLCQCQMPEGGCHVAEFGGAEWCGAVYKYHYPHDNL